MKKINELLSYIETKSFPNLIDLYSTEINHIISSIKSKVIFISGNDFLYFENGVIVFETKCVIGEKGFGCKKLSYKTPTGLHFISDFIGDGLDKHQRFIKRIPTIIEKPVNFGEFNPGVYGRILRLDGVEEKNKNTLSRGVYIHGNIHNWYWETDNLNRTKGCIGLKLDEMILFFDIIKKFKDKVFVYIEGEN